MVELIVNKPSPKQPYQAIDGQVGAWIEGRKFFITSPNTLLVYKPLLRLRQVYLQQDYRLGAEDPLLYPQPFIPDCCHLATIPHRSKNPEAPLAKWWTSLPPSTFVNKPDTVIKGLGWWSWDSLLPFANNSYLLHKRIEKYRTLLDTSAKPNSLITTLDKHLGKPSVISKQCHCPIIACNNYGRSPRDGI
ncbi:hypothetical protein PQX77_017481 [Marasmius sp. AFHP31]|nr:hypothetical protein PQX77_017481 [Marasmius sp. AFHP31]